MASTITTASAAYYGKRLQAYTSTGRLWVAVHDAANTRWTFWYSDNGTSFTESTSLRITTTDTHGAFAIDTTTNRAVFAHSTQGNASTVYARTNITAGSAWTALPNSSGGFPRYSGLGELTTFVKPSSSNYYVATFGLNNTSGSTYVPTLTVIEYTTSHAFVSGYLAEGFSSTTGGIPHCTIDHRHTGDGSTVASSSPDLFTAYVFDNDDTVRFVKHAWTGTGWAANTLRSMGTIYPGGWTSNFLSAAFDGGRYCMAWTNNADQTAIDVAERDAADTTSTARTILALSDGVVQWLAVSYDGAGDMVVHASGATSDDIERTQFVRATGIWDAWSAVDATTTVAAVVSSSRAWSSGKGINVVWRLASGDVDSITDFVNTAPSAPLWTAPGDNLAQDRGAALTLEWAFTDVDQGDAQSAYKIKRRVNGGSEEWWTGAAWGAETKITSATTSLAMASGWATDGDSVVYNVLTYDAADVVGPYSDGLTVIASVPVSPTLTAPATSATLLTSTPTVSWTVAEQSAYQIRVLTAGDVQLYSSGKITDTDTRSITLGYSLDNGLADLKFELTTWNTEDLAAVDTTTLVDVIYTAPATPTLLVAAEPDYARISIVVTDPTPTGSQPTVDDGHDLFVRVALGGRSDGERPVGGDGIRIQAGNAATTLYDYAAGSGVNNEYRVRSHASNGTSADSAWWSDTAIEDVFTSTFEESF